MAESAKINPTEASARPKYSTPKDKSCPYCGQAFTSSSLGRHLDLYVRERNPKTPDGIHLVEEIRKMRSTITRRRPRSSVGPNMDGLETPVTAVSTSGAATPATPLSAGGASGAVSAAPRIDCGNMGGSLPTPVVGMKVITQSMPSPSRQTQPTRASATLQKNRGALRLPSIGTRAAAAAATVRKHMLSKSQLEARTKLAEAQDIARATELALREVLSSWRAAKQHVDNGVMPFEPSPLSLDFPSLTLQFLQPPPSLFASTVTPTPTSWSTKAPGDRELGALTSFFREEFAKWKDGCVRATRAAYEEDMVLPPGGDRAAELSQAVGKAREQLDAIEMQVHEHVQATFTTWCGLPQAHRDELWVLELARGVAKSRRELSQQKEEHHRLAQENANLKTQIEHLNRLQQPQAFRLLTPATVPFERDMISHVLAQGALGDSGPLSLLADSRSIDLNTAVRRWIDRWRPVVAASRAASVGGGMGTQKTLDGSQPTVDTSPLSSISLSSASLRTTCMVDASQLMDGGTVCKSTEAAVTHSRPQSGWRNVEKDGEGEECEDQDKNGIEDEDEDDDEDGDEDRDEDDEGEADGGAGDGDRDHDMMVEGESFVTVHSAPSMSPTKQTIDHATASRAHPTQLRGQTPTTTSAGMHQSGMQRAGAMPMLMMEQARFLMQQQQQQQASHHKTHDIQHLDNMTRTMPAGLAGLPPLLAVHRHQQVALELGLQGGGSMYLE